MGPEIDGRAAIIDRIEVESGKAVLPALRKFAKFGAAVETASISDDRWRDGFR